MVPAPFGSPTLTRSPFAATVMNALRLISSFLLSSLGLVAQSSGSVKLGPFSSSGAVFATPGAPTALRHYQSDTPPASPMPAINGIAYDNQSLFTSVWAMMTPAQQSQIEIDAISAGNDVIPIVFAPGGPRLRPDRAPLGWAALVFSFAATPAATNLPHPMAERHASGGYAADLYSWILPGSTPLGAFADQMFLEVKAQEVQLLQTGDIEALDMSLALLAQNGGAADPLFAPNVSSIYFSLTKASAAHLANVLPVIAADASGATVFVVHRDPSTPPTWGQIQVARSATALGLQGVNANDPSDDEELDALGVWTQENLYVYSVQGPSTQPQLQAERQGQRGPLHTNTGVPVQNRIGDSDVDALCGFDPEMGGFSRWLGTPLAEQPPPIVLSATQIFDPSAGILTMVLHANGESPSDVTPATGSLFLELGSFGAASDGPPAVWTSLFQLGIWNGAGEFRINLPITFVLNVDFPMRVVLVSPAGTSTSSVVITRL